MVVCDIKTRSRPLSNDKPWKSGAQLSEHACPWPQTSPVLCGTLQTTRRFRNASSDSYDAWRVLNRGLLLGCHSAVKWLSQPAVTVIDSPCSDP